MIKRLLVAFTTITSATFLFALARRFSETLLLRQDVFGVIKNAPQFLLSSALIAFLLLPIFYLVYFIAERTRLNKLLGVSSPVIAILTIPILSFAWKMLPKGHGLSSKNTFCEIYTDGIVTKCGAAVNATSMLGLLAISLCVIYTIKYLMKDAYK